MRLLVAVVSGLAGDAACAKKRDDAVRVVPLHVELSGCAAVDGEAVCTLARDGRVRVYVASRDGATFALRGSDGRALDVPPNVATLQHEGTLYALTLPPEATELRVRAKGSPATVEGFAEATVRFRPEQPLPWLEEARAASARGERAAALAIYRPRTASTDHREAAIAAGQAARAELALGHVEESARLFRLAIEHDRASGRTSDAVDDSLALSFALVDRSHHFAEARAVLAGVRDLLPRYADGRVRAPYYEGVLASELGDRREALRRFREAEQGANRLGLVRLERQARNAIALELDLLGRYEEALAARRAQEHDLEAEGDRCGLVALRSGIGFGLLMIASTRHDDATLVREASSVLELAESDRGCDDNYLHAVTLGHRALAELLGGRPQQARKALAQARARVSEPPIGEGFFWLDLEARIALAQREPARARKLFAELEARALALVRPQDAWRGAYGRGVALEALGRHEEALEAYATAEDRLDDAGASIPLGEGRARFLADREKSAAAGIALLVHARRVEEALAWSRRARRRVVASLESAVGFGAREGASRAALDRAFASYIEERARLEEEAASDWKLALRDLEVATSRRHQREDALRGAIEVLVSAVPHGARARPASLELATKELAIVLHPAPGGGYFAFAKDQAGVEVATIAAVDARASAEALSEALLRPFARKVAASDRVRWFVPGALASLDLHALPFEGNPLAARVATSYALDLQALPEPVATSVPRALVVGDPERNLPHARRELQETAEALGGRLGLQVDVREGRAATQPEVLRLLEGAALVHYAGHATYGGEDGWSSTLPLAAGGHLAIADVFALHRAPRQVVLSGCEAAKNDTESPGETLGVAQAFVMAGTAEVVAPARVVSDATSLAFARALYAELQGGPPFDLAAAAARAARRLRSTSEGTDWANFRVYRR